MTRGDVHPWSEFVDPRSADDDDRSTQFLRALTDAQLLPMGQPAKDFELDARAFTEEERALLPSLVEDLGRWRGAQGHEGRAFASLWLHSVKALNRGDHDTILEEEGALKIRKLPGRFVMADEPRSFGADEDVSSLRFRAVSHYALMDATGRDLPPLLQFLYRLAWDKRESKTNDAVYDSPFDLRWCGFVTASGLSNGARLPWPSAPWTRFSRFESFRASWNELLGHAHKSFEPLLKVRIENELAAAFVFNSAGFQFSDWQHQTTINLRPDYPSRFRDALSYGASSAARREKPSEASRRNSIH
jgi:hypothetical protein